MTDQVLEDFLDKGIKDSTKRTYKQFLHYYTDCHGMTITQLIEEAEDDEDNGLRMRKRRINIRLKEFENWLNEKDYAPSRIRNALATVRVLYNYYDIKLPKPKSKQKPEEHITSEDILTKEEIEKAIRLSNTKYKAIILTMVSSGMGSAELRSLTVKNFLDGIKDVVKNPLKLPLDIGEIRKEVDESNAVPLIIWKDITRQKTNEKYTTFSTPETLLKILNYLEKVPPTDINQKLFRSPHNKPLGEDAFLHYFYDINKRGEFGKVGRTGKFKSHNLRKFFATSMERTSLGIVNTGRLMGHKVLDQTKRRYMPPDFDYLKFLYFENMASVTITEPVETKVYTDERINEIKAELKEEMKAEFEAKLLEQEKKNEAILQRAMSDILDHRGKKPD